MLVKEKHYYQSVMHEIIVDETLNIYMLNVYKLKNVRIKNSEKWDKVSTFSFLSKKDLDIKLDELLEDVKKLCLGNSGNERHYYKTQNCGDFPTHSYTYWLVKAYAEKLIEEKTKMPERFYKNGKFDYSYKKYLVQTCEKYQREGKILKHFNIEKEAKKFIERTGFQIRISPDEVVTFKETK